MSAADSPEALQRYLKIAEDVARGAGAMIREMHEKRSSGLKIESKGSTADAANVSVDLVTATDKACEEYIISTIKVVLYCTTISRTCVGLSQGGGGLGQGEEGRDEVVWAFAL